VILAYHNVIPDNETPTGAASAQLPLSSFQAQLDLLQDLCEILPLSEILSASAGGPARGFRASITFDDAYAGTVRVALPELAKRGLPATVFVPTGFLGGRSFWWDDLLMTGWEGDRVPLVALAGDDARVRAWAGDRTRAPRQGPHQVTAYASELSSAASTGLVTFAAHTENHRNLAELDPEEVRLELEASRAWLQERGLPTIPWIAYPYGLSTPQVRHMARTLGFEAGVAVSGGWIPRPLPSPMNLPRVNVPAGVTTRGFLLRLLGAIPS
jgi:peptidoglycan/xylan/chitin deacetylase (PgdA/CDA1 family)